MDISLIILSALIVLLMLGFGQRILDQLRMNDKQAILVLLLIAIGLIIPPIHIGELITISIGGFVIPFLICVYLFIKIGWSRDMIRATIGTFLTSGIIYGLEWIMPADPEELLIDPMIIYGVVAGLVAYILGRSRRNAFICAVIGVMSAQITQFTVNLWILKTPTTLGLGTGGPFGTMIIAAIVAVATAEFFGRAFESASPDKDSKRFNFETGQYDSAKNGRLKKKNKLALIENGKTKYSFDKSMELENELKMREINSAN